MRDEFSGKNQSFLTKTKQNNKLCITRNAKKRRVSDDEALQRTGVAENRKCSRTEDGLGAAWVSKVKPVTDKPVKVIKVWR